MCRGDPGGLAEERNRFYLTATEFSRTLESTQGPGSLDRVIGDVGSKTGFEDGLRERFGRPCE